jgi:hypothetical protein
MPLLFVGLSPDKDYITPSQEEQIRDKIPSGGRAEAVQFNRSLCVGCATHKRLNRYVYGEMLGWIPNLGYQIWDFVQQKMANFL